MELDASSITKFPEEIMDDSPSSTNAEPSISDSAETFIAHENAEKDEEAEAKEEEERFKYRLARRKALAMLKIPSTVPKLGKVMATANNTIDLTVEEDDPSNKWFKKTFAGKKKSPENKSFAVPHNIPRSGLKREDMKKQLQASMSAKRRKEQEQRRKMYLEDNEHLQQQSDDEEEEEEIIKKKKKTKKPKNDEYNSEDDEDYVPGGSPAENSSDEEAGEKKEEKADDEVSVNFMNDSFTFDVFNMKKRPGPGSTASSFDIRSQTGEPADKNNLFGDLNIQGGASAGLFDLCSDSFVGDGVEDTLQMLLNGEKKTGTATKPPSDNGKEDEEEEEENLLRKKTTKSKTSRVLDSDDEVEETPEEALPESYDVFESNEAEVANEETEQQRPQRIVFSGDEDSDDEKEEDGEDEEEEEEGDENDEEEEEEQEEEQDPVPEPNFDDEDDELAVIKRIEHKEYSQKIKKKTLFDDEASLSGDDVGSDLDDEESVENLYEMEEGDADDVPDDDTIRRENYKLMLKQENAKEQRALAKLQERLLADGDLGGVETNRQFRFKLREEAEIRVGADDGNDEEPEEEEAEEDEESKKARAEMIKYKIEHAAELEMLDHPGEEDDVFRRAGMMIKTVKKTVVEASEEITIKTRVGKPSLLSKSSLAVSFQEVLGGGAAAPKQMYVQTRNPTTSSESSRLSSGGVKRGRQSPEPTSSVKRVRQGKLSALE